MDRADRMVALFNVLSIVLGEYFDDSMLGGIVGLCDDLTDAILFLIRELKIGAAWAKFERAQADGTVSLMVPSDQAHLTKHHRWTPPHAGFGQVLGKELNLRGEIRIWPKSGPSPETIEKRSDRGQDCGRNHPRSLTAVC